MKLSSELLKGNDIDSRWFAGPFAQLKMLPAKAKGKRFEQISQELFEHKGHIVWKSKNSNYDRIVDGMEFEIKGSTITKGHDDYFSFLQIRPDQQYDFLIFVSFWFDGEIKVYKIPKEKVLDFISAGVFKKQHGGNDAESRTYCYNGTLEPFNSYFWFSETITN